MSLAPSILATFLLLLNCCCSQLAEAQNCQQQRTHSSLDNAVGAVDVKGQKLRVFELDGGVQVAEPTVQFTGSCSTLRYNRLYLRYQLSLPFNLDTNTLSKPLSDDKKVGKLTVTNVLLQLNAALADKKSKVTAVAVGGHDRWKLVFLCESFARCMGLNDELLSYPRSLEQAVRFSVVGWVGSSPVRFGASPSASPLHLRNCARGRWITFLRRVDDSLSFKKTWDEYVKGFGNPKSNYWMGLESLFQITATRDIDTAFRTPETALCRLRIDAVDMDGKKHWAEYGRFQVMGADQNYRLRVAEEMAGSTIKNMMTYHNEQQFSTYDRDHDANPKMSCSRAFGFGGFWYGNCHTMNPTGVMSNKKQAYPAVTYENIVHRDKWTWVQTKKISMKMKCD